VFKNASPFSQGNYVSKKQQQKTQNINKKTLQKTKNFTENIKTKSNQIK